MFTTQTLTKLAATAGWTLFSTLLLFVALRLYDFIDPIDYAQEIRKGNLAAGIKLGAVVIALAAIIVGVILSP
jgi:uncharacterized membrane protein YjfL (UPF0719 family)